MAVTVSFPPTSKIHNLQITSQDVAYPGTIKNLTTPASGVSAQTRLSDLAAKLFRLHLGTDSVTVLPMHAAYGAATAWDFGLCNDHMRDAYVNAGSVLVNPRYGPDSLWSGTAAQPGFTVNTTIAANIAVGSQVVTPAAMTNIVVGSILSIATGVPYETVVVTAITGTTFTAVFAKAHTGPGIAVTDGVGVYADRTFAALADWYSNFFAYYNKPDDGSGTKPVGWLGATLPDAGRPLAQRWTTAPVGPKDSAGVSLAMAVQNGGGGIRYLEVLNEMGIVFETPRQNRPQVTAATPTLTRNANGSLGQAFPLKAGTYGYKLISIDSTGDEINEGVEATIVATANDSITVSWTPNSQGGLTPKAHWIELTTKPAADTRTTGKMVVVTSGVAQTFTDIGAIQGSGAISPAVTGYSFSPREYGQVWDLIWTRLGTLGLQAGANSVKLVGAAPDSTSGAGSMLVQSVLENFGTTTGPSDTGYLSTSNFYQVLNASTHVPDIFSFHAYGSGFGGTTEAALMNAIDSWLTDATFGVNTAVDPYIGSVPVAITEMNVNASGASTLACRAFGVAWFASFFARLAAKSNGANYQYLHQFCFAQSNVFGMLAVADDVAYTPDGNPYLVYWLAKYLSAAMPAGSKVCTVSGVAAGTDVYAVALPPDFTKVRVVFVNRDTSVAGGANRSETINLAGASTTGARRRIIDSTTDNKGSAALSYRDLPAPTQLGTVTSATIALPNGYGVGILEFDTAIPTSSVGRRAGMRRAR